MTIREMLEKIEADTLVPRAAKSSDYQPGRKLSV